MALKYRFGDRIKFVPFLWSGDNSQHARSLAALDLGQHILRCDQECGHPIQILIAHSHGGNVCLYALRDPVVQSKISGVVTLATPFIYCRMRHFGEHRIRSLFALVCLVLILMIIASWNISELLKYSMGIERIPLLVKFIVYSVTSFVALLSMKAISEFDIGPLLDRMLVSTRSFEYGIPANRALLVIRVPGDEASSVLIGSHLFSWFVTRSGRVLDRIYSVGMLFGERMPPSVRFTFTVVVLLLIGLLLYPPALSPMSTVTISILVLLSIIVTLFSNFGLFIELCIEGLAGAILLPLIVLLALSRCRSGSRTY